MKTLQYVRDVYVARTMMGYGGQNVLQGKRDVEVRISSMDVMLGEDGRVHWKVLQIDSHSDCLGAWSVLPMLWSSH